MDTFTLLGGGDFNNFKGNIQKVIIIKNYQSSFNNQNRKLLKHTIHLYLLLIIICNCFVDYSVKH